VDSYAGKEPCETIRKEIEILENAERAQASQAT
jgi:hypothetical protein